MWESIHGFMYIHMCDYIIVKTILSDLVSRRQWNGMSEQSKDIMGIVVVRAKQGCYPLPEETKLNPDIPV